MLLRTGSCWMDIELEHIGWNGHRHTGVGDVDDTSDPPLDRRAAENDVGLLLRVAELREILDRIEAGPPHRHRGIVVELLARLCRRRRSLEDQEVAIVRIDRADLEQRIGQPVFGRRHP